MNLIRFALVADAAATVATGALLAIGGSLLADLTGLPATATLPLGLFLVAFAAFVAWVGMQRETPRGATMLIVIVNAAWVVASLIVLLAGTFPLTLLGVAFVIAQAVAVAALAALQWVGLGRARALA
ncbi:hypothetical protein ASC89_15990 [Devosia sp. Root413D1]|uniref:hypothetical protein n=1 Tax=Devosia sp. Root413D1 TaxID=1736531 RepID=UPI0006FFFFB4|nr:hypothetical protein [Devosia sp. Root413D1]KQW78287.1 hypothetical protein ASC89_15990 [Devosia sp. Root413D1]